MRIWLYAQPGPMTFHFKKVSIGHIEAIEGTKIQEIARILKSKRKIDPSILAEVGFVVLLSRLLLRFEEHAFLASDLID